MKDKEAKKDVVAKEAKELKLTKSQQEACESMGIDWNNIDWDKIYVTFIKFKEIVELWFGRQPTFTGAVPKMDHDHCDHAACCMACIQHQMAALECLMQHYDQCCKENQPK